MQICCTKKLLDEIKVVPEQLQEDNDLFCWSAHILTINRRKAVVVVNDSSRFGFVLYGLKAKDFSQLGDLIQNGIRRCLTDVGIKADVVDKYIGESADMFFTKTRGPRYVGRLNKACERVEIFDDRLELSALYQHAITKIMNNDLFKPSKELDYQKPNELLMQDFENRYGAGIIQCEAADLLIKLDLGAYTASRRILVPISITFEELHEIIQAAYDWEGHHLHGFNIYDKKGKCILNIIGEDEEVFDFRQVRPVALDKDVRIDEYVRKGYKIVYCYDYGDNWTHQISIRGIIPDYDKNYPTCVMGEGNRPPEDVGGIPGYEYFLEIMSDPNHDEYESMKDWVDGQWYRDFDMELVNRRLKYLK